ncbi:MAG TPA: LacI family DNA-binding transcriptional regulator, partial [Aggregatilineales bacterium]|nr:LacI family DNA-binding transcriptional regulator [Aggregatilineales bacterium]
MPEKPRITLKDVARVAGVSPKSISRVINDEGGVSEETRQRIQEAISSLGYVANPVARRLRGASNVIGLVVSGFEDYAGQILRGISQSSQHLRYNVILYVQHTQGQPLESYQS